MKNKSYKLLIVDDEPEIGELLTYNFRKRGFDVMTAANGFSGMKTLEQFLPDVIILDIMMPFVNGINMCKEIKNDPRFKHIPVLFLSATNNDELINAALEAGGNEIYFKTNSFESAHRHGRENAAARSPGCSLIQFNLSAEFF